MLTVHEAVAKYWEVGWKLCRIQPGTKSPLNGGWNKQGNEITKLESFTPGCGVGLLHAWSGTCALDIDNYPVARQWLADRGVDLDAYLAADDAVRIVSGRVDSAKLLYRLREPRPGANCAPFSSADKNGKPTTKMGLDFRCATANGLSVQDVLPPSIHPGRGRPYEWHFGLYGDWRVLPDLPADLEAIWDELRSPTIATEPTILVPTGAAPARIEAWLATQDPSMNMHDWIVVGMKLHAEYQGSMEGFEVWQRWSSKSIKWDDDARNTMLSRWKGFRLEGRGLTSLEPDLRSLPAEPEEFESLVGDAPPAKEAAPAAAAQVQLDAEPAYMRDIRGTMQDYVILQTGGAKPYFILPGHPIPEIREAAGLAGIEVSGQQLANIFGPYLPPTPAGRRTIPTDPAEVIRHAKWRQSVHRMAFRPGGELNYVSQDGHTYLNAYRSINVKEIRPRASDIAPLEWLLCRVLNEKDQPGGGVFASWLLRLYAFVLQNPGVKVRWAPLLYSREQGTGKTTLMETLPALLFGRQYVKPMVHSILRERFASARFDSTWWVCISEMHADNGKIDAKTIANKLKPWITDDTIPIEKKGVDSFEIKNYLQLTAASNHSDALFIEEGATDRRWLIGQMLEKPLTVEEMAMLNPLLGDDFKRDPRAQGWLKWYFLHDVNVKGFNPSEPPPETSAKGRVRAHSRSTWEDDVFEAFETRSVPFDKDFVQPTDITRGLLAGRGVTKAKAVQLIELVKGKKLAHRYAFARELYCIRNIDQWALRPGTEVREHLLKGTRPFADEGSDLVGKVDADLNTD